MNEGIAMTCNVERCNSATARGLQAEAKRASSGLNNIEFLAGDIEHADFPSKSFDAILCSSAIFYFDMPSTTTRLKTWLKPGGLLAYNTLQVAPCYHCNHQIHLLHALHSPATHVACIACHTDSNDQCPSCIHYKCVTAAAPLQFHFQACIEVT